MDTLCEANLRQSRDLFSLFQNIPVFGEHLNYADVITAIASFSDSNFFFFFFAETVRTLTTDGLS